MRPASYYMNQGVDGRPLPSISDRLRSMGMDSSVENRPMIMPIKEDGEWIAPEWFHSMARGAMVPVQTVLGGTVTPADAAMAVVDYGTGGLLASRVVPNAVPAGDVLGTFVRVPPKEFIERQGRIVDALPKQQRVLTEKKAADEILNVNRTKDGGLYVGKGQDEGGAFALLPKQDSVELGAVVVAPEKQGVGVGKRAAKEAVKKNTLSGSKPLYVEAFNKIKETGIDNAGYWRGLGFDKEIRRFKFDPELAPKDYTYSPADISWLQYTGGLLRNPDSAQFKPQGYKPWNSQLFDVEGLDQFSRYPSAEQLLIERLNPVRGLTPRMEAMLSDPQSVPRLMDLYGQGQRKGGGAWFNTRPLLDESIELFGDDLGRHYWGDTMGVSSAMSPQTKVREEIIRSSFIRHFQNKYGRMPEKGEVPEGLGAVSLFSNMIPMAKDFQSGAGIGKGMLGKADKVRSYAQNKLGNMAPATGDVHMERIMMSPYTKVKNRQGKPSKLNKKFSDLEYGAFEDRMGEIARRTGAEGGGMVQPNIWVGGSDITGVADHRPFLQLYEQEIMNTARKTGQTPKEVLRGVLSGEQYFLK